MFVTFTLVTLTFALLKLFSHCYCLVCFSASKGLQTQIEVLWLLYVFF